MKRSGICGGKSLRRLALAALLGAWLIAGGCSPVSAPGKPIGDKPSGGAPTTTVLPGPSADQGIAETGISVPISGAVRFGGMGAAAGILVIAYPTDGRPGGAAFSTVTAADGTFILMVPDGTYNVVARKPGTSSKAVVFRIQANTVVNLTLEPAGAISGKVAAAGSPDLSGASVFVPGTDLVAAAAADGRFLLRSVPAGDYTLVIQHTGYEDAKVETVSVGGDATASVPDIELSALPALTAATGRIAGRLRFFDGSNPGDIAVGLAASTGATASARTASNGSYAFDVVPVGYVKLTVARARYHEATAHVAVLEDRTVQAPDIEILTKHIVTTLASSSATAEFEIAAGGVAHDGTGDLYVGVPAPDCTIRKIDLATREVSVVAGSPGNCGGTDGAGGQARFGSPQNLLYLDGLLFVSDDCCAIRQIDLASQAVTTIAGGSYGSADGVGSAAQFKYPQGLAVDPAGSLFVADGNNHAIRKILLTTRNVTTIAGNGQSGFADDIGAAARFTYPRGLAYDRTKGWLYVAEARRIRKVVLATSQVLTVAGSADCCYGEGQGTAAIFREPRDLVLSGNALFVLDSGNFAVRRVDLSTLATTMVAGGFPGFLDGIGDSAGLSFTEALAIDPTGNRLFVADAGNKRIRMVSY